MLFCYWENVAIFTTVKDWRRITSEAYTSCPEAYFFKVNIGEHCPGYQAKLIFIFILINLIYLIFMVLKQNKVWLSAANRLTTCLAFILLIENVFSLLILLFCLLSIIILKIIDWVIVWQIYLLIIKFNEKWEGN